MTKLDQARAIINDVDKKMAELFEERMRASQMVAEYKIENSMPILDAAREDEVIRKNSERIDDEDIRAHYINFLRETMHISRNYQRRLLEGMRIAFSGIEGAFAHIAAMRLFPDAQKIAYSGFREAYNAVVNGECDSAVLPLENSFAGEIGMVTDLLFSGPLYINGTYELAVTHDLLAVPGTRLEEIEEVVSHPQALNQCASFIREHNFREISYDNTALAAQYVAEKKDKKLAAIASVDAAKLYGLEILARGINEKQTNTTRFAVLSRAENRQLSSRSGAHFALMFTVKNEAGSLARALNIIGAHGFNLRTLRSRPMKELLWQYYFYVEAEGNIHSNDGRYMLEELGICCDRLKSVGSFVRFEEDREGEKE